MALYCMAHCYKERKSWVEMTECCEEALALLPEVAVGILNDHMKERLLFLLADAAEGRGDLSRALEYDEEAKNCWVEGGKTAIVPGLVACDRRAAVQFLKAGMPGEAVRAVTNFP